MLLPIADDNNVAYGGPPKLPPNVCPVPLNVPDAFRLLKLRRTFKNFLLKFEHYQGFLQTLQEFL